MGQTFTCCHVIFPAYQFKLVELYFQFNPNRTKHKMSYSLWPMDNRKLKGHAVRERWRGGQRGGAAR